MSIKFKNGPASMVAATAMLLASCSGSTEPGVERREEAFDQDCAQNAVAKIIDPARWRHYKELAARHSVRIDRRPSLVESEGYTIRYGRKRSFGRASFPPGTHDDEITIVFKGRDIAVLTDRVKVTRVFGAYSSSTCIRDGIGRYF